MATFGNKLFSFAATALMCAGAASAQTPPASCTATVPNGASIMRAESTTELAGEIQVVCTGGPGGVGNFQVNFGAVAVTSKVLSTASGNNTTDAFTVVNGTTVQGIVSTSNPSVISFAVPLTAGATTTFQLANIRVNSSTLAGTNFAPVTAQVIAISTIVQANITSLTVGFVQKGLSNPTVNGAALASSTSGFGSYVICSSPASGTPKAWIHFGEVFPQAFKTQGTPSTVLQSEFVSNTESGIANATSTSIGTATSGTRLSVTISNLPAAVTVFMPFSIADDAAIANSISNINPPAPVSGGKYTGVISLTGSATGAFAAPTASSSTKAPDAGVGGYVAYTPTGGAITVYYEVTSASAVATEAYTIPLFVYYAANAPVATNASSTVLVSFAPTGSTNVPNFAATTNTPLSSSRFNTCTTSLLFPFVANTAGFDTGFAIANTSIDPFGSNGATAQAGTCTLNFYGNSATNPTPFTTVNVASGNTVTGLLSTVAPGFQGYMIAQCQFQFAHAFVFVTDGFGGPGKGLSEGYLALVIPDTNQTARAAGFAEQLNN